MGKHEAVGMTWMSGRLPATEADAASALLGNVKFSLGYGTPHHAIEGGGPFFKLDYSGRY